MSLRKIAVLLAAGGLMVGLVGSGVAAQFADQVTATQHFNVGTFSCIITDGGGGTVSADQKSVDFTSPLITSSAAGTAPFHFTVQNSGQINAQLTVSEAPALSSPWSYMPITPGASFPLAAGVSQVIGVGVQWTTLSQSDTGTHGTVTYTVNCNEVPAAPATVNVDSSTLHYAATGWGGWSCPAGDTIVSASSTGVPLTLTLWKPGATAGGATYPATPFGYTYAANEQGAIGQATGTAGDAVIHLVCQP